MSKAREDIISTVKGRIKELKSAQKLYDGVMLGAGYLVRVGPLHLKFNIEGRKVKGASPCKVEQAHLFTIEDARKVARGTVNGRGESGEAIHISQAISDELAMVEGLLKKLA